MQTETTIEACGAKLTVNTEALFKAWLQQQFSPAVPVNHFGLLALAEGEIYAGVILTEDGRPSHHLVLLPGEREKINHADATEWAKSIGGELPTRNEQSLLFANAKKHFQESAYWSQELHSDDGWAWCQFFGYGYQYDTHTNHALLARAVRRLII